MLIAEFVCLIPTIFPNLESQAEKQEEGGATGAGAVLWPICMVASQVKSQSFNISKENEVVNLPFENHRFGSQRSLYWFITYFVLNIPRDLDVAGAAIKYPNDSMRWRTVEMILVSNRNKCKFQVLVIMVSDSLRCS